MKKILIVDDQNLIRTVLKTKLEAIEGVSVVEAVNGNEALGKAKVAHPVLIFLDLVMPNKDGFQTLEELKGSEKTKDIPVIIVTSNTEKENVAKVKALGAEQIIDKADMDTTDFAAIVKKYL